MSKIGDKFIFENESSALMKYPAWTPVSREVPTKEGMYIVTFDDGFVTSVEWNEGDWELWADSGEVIAWMPVPQPYKE